VTDDQTSDAGPQHDPTSDTYEVVVVRAMDASPSDIYHAWTREFDTWFALPGALTMTPSAGEPYWFDVEFEGARHAHYGKFIGLETDRLIEMTWVTGRGGTLGAETLVTVELHPYSGATMVRLRHGGFYDVDSARQHGEAWPKVLEHLDDVLARRS
jgi:uncharacterized protein YndB with AHSA1/START domain